MSKIIDLSKKLLERWRQGNQNLSDLKSGKNLKPKGIWFGVTDRCNSHCTHCHIWKKTPSPNPLTLEEIEKAFRDPLLSEVEFIVNSGGEALLRPDIVELIKLESKLFPGVVLDLSTNGLLPDRALTVVKEILQAGIKINVGVSLDGLGDQHDQVRGVPGNFAKVDYLLNQLNILRKEYPTLLRPLIGFTLSDLTIDSYEGVKDYARNLNVECMPQWYNQSEFYDNSISRPEASKEKMLKAVKNQPNTIIREKWLRLLNGRPIKFKCFAAQTFFVLKADGQVAPCLSFWDSNFGNVREQTPTEIWESGAADEVRKLVANCPGCLNSWGVTWSISAAFYPWLWFYLRHPKAIFARFMRKD